MGILYFVGWLTGELPAVPTYYMVIYGIRNQVLVVSDSSSTRQFLGLWVIASIFDYFYAVGLFTLVNVVHSHSG